VTPFLLDQHGLWSRKTGKFQLIYGDKIYADILWVKFLEITNFIITNSKISWFCSSPNSYLLYLSIRDIVNHPPHLAFIYEAGIEVC